MTPEAVQELVAETPMPPGYRLQVEPQRKFKYRALWAVQVWRGDEKVRGRAWYSVGAGVRDAHQWAWGEATR